MAICLCAVSKRKQGLSYFCRRACCPVGFQKIVTLVFTRCRFANGSMPAQLMLFIEKLPTSLEPDQPLPDIDYVIDVLLTSPHPEMGDGQANGSRGVKRPAPGMQDGVSHADIFTIRQKMKHAN